MSEPSHHGYDPRVVEPRWYPLWEGEGFFHADPDSSQSPYSIVIPPPNITGSLHMGHALNNTLQDVLIRWRRMIGDNTLWMPGTDHAGIATQNVVERQLLAEGHTRQQMGREAFVARVWQWREQSGRTIIDQLKKLGASCDWVRESFTMDEPRERAVLEAFVQLWQDGLLYRAERLVNWCPRCETALADIEVVHEESDGHLWHIRYPLAENPKDGLVVATTRPETMLADTAVAVHPEDPRYAHAIGQHVILPLVGRWIPVIADPYVSREFGTGALKITPGHDFNDFEIGHRHDLETIATFRSNGTINEAFLQDASEDARSRLARYLGRDRFKVRRMVLEDLRQEGLLVKEEPYRYALGRCYRCETAVEPYLTPQWFVRMKPLAEPAIRAVEEGRVRFVPPQWEKNYFEWMHNIRDWCISRQIWWGHQIPAWYCLACDKDNILMGGVATGLGFIPKDIPMQLLEITPKATPIVAREKPHACPRCGGQELYKDPDVLDTWFSSALWPFSTLGWPEQTKELAIFYPTTVLVTAFDILFFWVARMIMMGLKFMGDVPFRHVYIHALVRDQEGQKMSKSKGNVIDPLEVIGRYGTDAFRFTLASLAAMGRDIKLSEERIAGYQNFVNKLWNASRFVLLNLKDSAIDPNLGVQGEFDLGELNLTDRWILSRLNSTTLAAKEAVESYRFNEYAHVLYQFTWHEFCDWYIEMSKLSLNGTLGDDPAKTRRVLAEVLGRILRLTHPLMPFVTEEIWQNLHPGEKASLMVGSYPVSVPQWKDAEAEKKAGFLTDVIRAIRNLRTELGYPPSKEASVTVFGEKAQLESLQSHEPYLRSLARVDSLTYATHGERPRGAATAVVGTSEVYLPVADRSLLRDEESRLAKELGKLESEFIRVQKKLANQNFLSKAKEEIVDKEKRKAEELEETMQTLRRSLERILEIKSEIG